ncbi:hypothetical protein VNO77_34106 [Canavalia gladiata]|uniref:DRBM domain-containing protein n=1 Tax=Canavalia gladiata TaxID=3824 RepID=A0AAN9KFZ9_CANGL
MFRCLVCHSLLFCIFVALAPMLHSYANAIHQLCNFFFLFMHQYKFLPLCPELICLMHCWLEYIQENRATIYAQLKEEDSMFKTKVQELCQRRSWNLPEYATSREGPDHNPRFSSTVTVNGFSFSSPSPTRTAKQAQNDAAMLAFHHFSPPSPSPSPSPLSSSLPSPLSSSLPSPLSSSLPSPLSSSLPSPSLPPPFPQDSLSICGLPSFPQPSLCASPPVNVELPQKGACYIASGSPGPNTDVDDILPTAGVLQPVLEKVCQTSQISSPVTTVIDPMTAGDHKNMSHLYKSQLQRYAQKRNLSLPVYSPEWEGPPHAMRFKCKVTFDGQTYESDKFYSSLKAAEHAAAEVALMSLSPSGVQEDHSGLYKSLLQELIQKEGFCLPIYSTSKSGEAHMPIFVSQVEVEGEPFTGQEAKSKKQAEINAAKVAYMALKECKGKSDKKSLVPVSSHQGQACEFSTYCSEANVVTGLQPHTNPKSPVSPGLVNQNQPDKDKNSMALKKFDEDVLKRVLMRKRSVSKDVTTHTEIDSSAEEDQMKGIVPCKRNCSNPSEGAKDVEQGPSTKLCKEKMTFDSKSAPFLEFVGVGDEIRLWDAHFQTGPVIRDPLTSDEDRKKLEEIGGYLLSPNVL